MFRSFLFLLPVLVFFSCLNAPDFPDEPVLTYVGMSKDTILQFNRNMLVEDSLTIQFSFTDGDGDLSFTRTDSISDIFLFDSRIDSVATPTNIPFISGGNTSSGISGDIFLTIVNSSGICCIRDRGNGFRDLCFSSPEFPLDTFSYGIQILDRAGNISNMIRTEKITVRCIPE